LATLRRRYEFIRRDHITGLVFQPEQNLIMLMTVFIRLYRGNPLAADKEPVFGQNGIDSPDPFIKIVQPP
jgi:hypothetical protein